MIGLFIAWILSKTILIAVMLSAVICQGIKIVLNVIKDKKGVSIQDLVVTGGMPSTHSALVSSLFAILLLETGLNSVTVIATVLFIIVITDSMGVRRTAGEEAKLMNKIIKMKKLNIKQLSYSRGHKPIEVLAGIFIGFSIAFLVFFIL